MGFLADGSVPRDSFGGVEGGGDDDSTLKEQKRKQFIRVKRYIGRDSCFFF